VSRAHTTSGGAPHPRSLPPPPGLPCGVVCIQCGISARSVTRPATRRSQPAARRSWAPENARADRRHQTPARGRRRDAGHAYLGRHATQLFTFPRRSARRAQGGAVWSHDGASSGQCAFAGSRLPAAPPGQPGHKPHPRRRRRPRCRTTHVPPPPHRALPYSTVISTTAQRPTPPTPHRVAATIVGPAVSGSATL